MSMCTYLFRWQRETGSFLFFMVFCTCVPRFAARGGVGGAAATVCRRGGGSHPGGWRHRGTAAGAGSLRSHNACMTRPLSAGRAVRQRTG